MVRFSCGVLLKLGDSGSFVHLFLAPVAQLVRLQHFARSHEVFLICEVDLSGQSCQVDLELDLLFLLRLWLLRLLRGSFLNCLKRLL